MNSDTISRQQAIDIAKELIITVKGYEMHNQAVMNYCAEIVSCHPYSRKPAKDVSTWVNGRMKLNTDIHLRVHVVKEG